MKDYVMQISNTLYFNETIQVVNAKAVSLTASLKHQLTYLNQPTSGYHSPRMEKTAVFFTHPTLNKEFKMAMSEYMAITLKDHWANALLVISDEGQLFEFKPETMTIVQHLDIEQFAQRLIAKKDRPLEAYRMFWVDKLHHTTQSATIICLQLSSVCKLKLSFSELITNWCILDAMPSASTIELFKSVLRSPDASPFVFSDCSLSVEFSSESGLRFKGPNATYAIPEFSALIQDSARKGVPMYCMAKDLSTDVVDLTPRKPPKLIEVSETTLRGVDLLEQSFHIHSSVLSKYWDSLPIQGYAAWDSMTSAQYMAMRTLNGDKDFNWNLASNLSLMANHSTFMACVIKVGDKYYSLYQHVSIAVTAEGQFALLRRWTVETKEEFTEVEQKQLLEAITLRYVQGESLYNSLKKDTVRSKDHVSSCSIVSCDPSLTAIQAKHFEMVSRLDGYMLVNLVYGSPSLSAAIKCELPVYGLTFDTLIDRDCRIVDQFTSA